MKAQQTSLLPQFFHVRHDVSKQVHGWISDYVASLTAAFFLLVQFALPHAYEPLAMLFLFLGFIFPGMAHGALDYHLGSGELKSRSKKIRLLALYIGSMVVGILMWFISPLLILLIFLANSAYHFGETDLQQSSAHSILFRLSYGASLILFLFFTHAKETAFYLLPFGLSFPTGHPETATMVGLVLFILTSYILIRQAGIKNSLNIILVLIISTQLPLILGFGVYYILNHSLSAWKHLRVGLRSDHSTMLKKAAPFTLAGLLFIGLAYFTFQRFQEFHGQPIPLVIIGLSAITFPHTFSMSLFYRKVRR